MKSLHVGRISKEFISLIVSYLHRLRGGFAVYKTGVDQYVYCVAGFRLSFRIIPVSVAAQILSGPAAAMMTPVAVAR